MRSVTFVLLVAAPLLCLAITVKPQAGQASPAGCLSSLLIDHVPPANAPPNMDTVRKQISDYYASGAYDQEMSEILQTATQYFNALPLQNNSAMVFDIDETALSNWQEMKAEDFGCAWPHSLLVERWLCGRLYWRLPSY